MWKVICILLVTALRDDATREQLIAALEGMCGGEPQSGSPMGGSEPTPAHPTGRPAAHRSGR